MPEICRNQHIQFPPTVNPSKEEGIDCSIDLNLHLTGLNDQRTLLYKCRFYHVWEYSIAACTRC